jgi:uncharacterized protein
MKIGILSDTHSYLDPKIFDYFKEVDEIWHAGDIGSVEVVDELRKFKPLRVVYGNIDDATIRMEAKEFLRFKAGNKEVLITHIAGRPGKYSQPLFEELTKNGAPDILVCGHSHVLLVQMDKRYNMLWMNPGAFGIKGFHKVRTLLRFEINGDKIEKLEVIELARS